MVTLLQDVPEEVAASPAENSVGAAAEDSHHSGNGQCTQHSVTDEPLNLESSLGKMEPTYVQIISGLREIDLIKLF